MGVWEMLGDAETHARLLRHPHHRSVADDIGDLVVAARALDAREQMRPMQERLLTRLLEAERHYFRARRLEKRNEGDPIDVMFWRRACVQLRAIGDAMAWKFLGYDRPKIVLLGFNERPGMMVGKAGSAGEWNACNEHWDDGRPCLMTGITNQFTVADLLIAAGDTLQVNEVKSGNAKMSAQQRARMNAIDTALKTSRLETPTGATYVIKSPVALASYWRDADAAMDEAERAGLSTWVPTPGVAVLFAAAAGPPASIDEVNERVRSVQEGAAAQMGPATHRIITDSSSYPYRPNRAVPIPLLPVSDRHAAMLLTGEMVFRVELAVDRLAHELTNNGLAVEVVMDDSHDKLVHSSPVLRWTAGPMKRGIVHAGVVEQVGVELNDLVRWAQAFATADPPLQEGKVGLYVCQSDEDQVWV